jgi:hypothetical protein
MCELDSQHAFVPIAGDGVHTAVCTLSYKKVLVLNGL